MENKAKMEGWAAEALKLAAKYGAEQARVGVAHSRFISIGMRAGEMEKAISSIKQGLSLQVFINGRFGAHSTSDFSNLNSFVERACAFTAKLAPDEKRGLPDITRMAITPGPDLKTYDEKLAALPLEFWLELAARIDNTTKQQGKGLDFVSSQGGAYLDVDEKLVADSRGFSGYERGTSGFALSSLTIMDKGNKRRQGYWYSGGTAAGHVLDRALAEALAQKAKERALSQLKAKPGPGGRFPVLVENRVAGDLVNRLLGAMNGASLYNKTSYLQDRLNTPIGSSRLTIVDKPHLPGALGSRWFDDEGVASKDLVLVEKGTLKNYLLDTYYARSLGLSPTTGSPSNIILLSSEDNSPARLMAGIKSGLLLTSFMGGNFNSTTGDFSFGLSGQWIENGMPSYPVEAMNMSGNFNELWQSLEAIGNDPFPYSGNMTPSLLFGAAELSA